MRRECRSYWCSFHRRSFSPSVSPFLPWLQYFFSVRRLLRSRQVVTQCLCQLNELCKDLHYSLIGGSKESKDLYAVQVVQVRCGHVKTRHNQTKQNFFFCFVLSHVACVMANAACVQQRLRHGECSLRFCPSPMLLTHGEVKVYRLRMV